MQTEAVFSSKIRSSQKPKNPLIIKQLIVLAQMPRRRGEHINYYHCLALIVL